MPTKLQTFQYVLYGIFTHIYGKLFMNQESNLMQISWKIFCPLTDLFFVCCSQFWGPSTSFALI